MSYKKLLPRIGLALVPLTLGALLLQGQGKGSDGPRLFAQVLQFVERHAVDSLGNAEIYEKAARGLIKGLNDPYADLYSPEELANFQRNTLGNNSGGIGMQIESQDGLVTVTRVFPGTPGERGGVQAGDRILMVDSVAVTGMRIGDVSDRLTGVAGTKVQATFGREGVNEPIRTTFTRAVIRVPTVPYTLVLDGGVGYLPLQRFNENSAAQFEEALNGLRRKGAKSFIIDLRGNPGGSLEQSLKISGLFLRTGQELARVKHRGRDPEVYNAYQDPIIDSMAIVVLIDNFSASASEIVAGSLQDHDRALVVGNGSFGKGLVQTLYPLDGGWAIKLTTGKWYTPSGRSIQGEHTQLTDGRFVEYAPDSLESDSARKARPMFRSDAGRIVYGGGGITPDVVVRQDTLTAGEQELLRSIGSKWPSARSALYGYALELKGTVRPDFAMSQAWVDELYRRMAAVEAAPERGLYDRNVSVLTRLLEQQLSGLAFGDSAAFRRIVPQDRQLQTALEYLKKTSSQRELLAMAAASSKPAEPEK